MEQKRGKNPKTWGSQPWSYMQVPARRQHPEILYCRSQVGPWLSFKQKNFLIKMTWTEPWKLLIPLGWRCGPAKGTRLQAWNSAQSSIKGEKGSQVHLSWLSVAFCLNLFMLANIWTNQEKMKRSLWSSFLISFIDMIGRIMRHFKLRKNAHPFISETVTDPTLAMAPFQAVNTFSTMWMAKELPSSGHKSGPCSWLM